MYVAGSNNLNQPQYHSNCNCGQYSPAGQQLPNTPLAQNVPSTQQNPQGNNVVYQNPQPGNPANVQVPANASAVNIQIFNPTVAAPGGTGQTYNVNQPSYYPPNYYTGQIGNGNNTGTNNTEETKNNTDKKTEKKKIVELTDEYIMNLESHLNSQDANIRRDTAREVYARLEEDPSRKDDKALTALVNKMLQDPSEEVRLIALAALDGRYCLGDDYTVGVLQNMQKSNGGYGQDAIDATNILLKMSGKQVEKEVEVDPARDHKKKDSETKTEKKVK